MRKRECIFPNINRVVKPVYVYPDGIKTVSTASPPSHCPDCGEMMSWKGVHWACANSECSNMTEKDLLVWLNCLVPTDGLGDKLIIKILTEYLGENLSVEKVMAYRNGKWEYPLDTCCPMAQSSVGSQVGKVWGMLNRLNTESLKLEDALRALNIQRLGHKASEQLATKHRGLTPCYAYNIHWVQYKRREGT